MAQFINMHRVELANGAAPVVPLSQIYMGDANANRIGAIVTLNGEAAPLGGVCSGTAILADGSTVALTGNVSGNEAYVTLPPGCYSVEGQIQVFVRLTVSGVTTTLLSAFGTVRLTETGTVIDPGTIIPSVAQLIASIAQATASIPADYTALLGSIAPTFSTSANYVAGDYVWYSGTLYRYDVAHAAGDWSAAQVSAVDVTDEITTIKGNVPGIFQPLTQYMPGDYVWHAGQLFRATRPNWGNWRGGANFEGAALGDGFRHTIGGHNTLCLFAAEDSANRFVRYDVGEALAGHENEQITVSFDLKASTARTIQVYAYQDAGTSIADSATFAATTSYARQSFTTTVRKYGAGSETNAGAIGFYDAVGDNTISIRNLKIELGAIATPWQMSAQDAYAEVLPIAETAMSGIAPHFAEQESYSAGALVWHRGQLYRFTVAHTGAWIGTDAAPTTLAAELEALLNH